MNTEKPFWIEYVTGAGAGAVGVRFHSNLRGKVYELTSVELATRFEREDQAVVVAIGHGLRAGTFRVCPQNTLNNTEPKFDRGLRG